MLLGQIVSEDKLSHLLWIQDIVSRLSDIPNDESFDSAYLDIYVSEFSLFTGAQKKDIFLYLLGRVVALTSDEKE